MLSIIFNVITFETIEVTRAYVSKVGQLFFTYNFDISADFIIYSKHSPQKEI